MAEFPDKNGRFPCLEEMEEDIYLAEGDDKPQQQIYLYITTLCSCFSMLGRQANYKICILYQALMILMNIENFGKNFIPAQKNSGQRVSQHILRILAILKLRFL